MSEILSEPLASQAPSVDVAPPDEPVASESSIQGGLPSESEPIQHLDHSESVVSEKPTQSVDPTEENKVPSKGHVMSTSFNAAVLISALFARLVFRICV